MKYFVKFALVYSKLEFIWTTKKNLFQSRSFVGCHDVRGPQDPAGVPCMQQDLLATRDAV